NESLSPVWRTAVARALARDVRWCFCSNGVALRVVDAQRTWSREYLELDLQLVAADRNSSMVAWSLLRAESLSRVGPFFDRAVELSARHALDVCRSLGRGVIDALGILLAASLGAQPRRPRRDHRDAVFAAALTVLYRVLFLLFAEARGLVPMWHPIY